MAKLFYTNIDLKGNQLLNGVIHSADTAPTEVTAVAGQVYYNTDDKLMYQYDGTQWVVVGGSVEELPTDVTKVVTGSSTDKGTATLQTTALKDMKVGVGLTNLSGVTADTTLSVELQAIDTALQEVKTTYVKAGGTYENEQLLVAGVDGEIKNAKTTGYTIASELKDSDNFKIPTSAAVANYIGSLAGGITYIGTIGGTGATEQKLPTEGVNVGDAYMVAAAGTYTPLTKASNVGDLIICNGTSPTISWTEVPIDFTVEDKALTNFAPKDGLQTIATVDGKDITMSLKGIEIVESGDGVFVTGITADTNNKLTLTKGNALTTVSPTTAVKGVVTSVTQNSDNQTINVTYADLETAEKAGIQYVTNVSQASDGKITVSGANFDSSISGGTNAPTTSAVKDYVDGLIESLDGSATIATNSDGVVTLKAGIVETDGKIKNNSDSNITLAKVATTGKAEDVDATAIDNGDGVVIVPEGTVQESLQYIARKLDEAVAGSVTSFGGKTGVITVGNGLKMTVNEADSEVSTNVTGYIVNTAGDGKSLNIDSAKVDSNYTVATTTNLATVGTVKTAIEGLDASITNSDKGQTLATLTETNGKIAATFQNISITSSQVTDLSKHIGVDSVTTGEANGTIGVSINGGDASDVAVKGLQSAAYVDVNYFEKKFTDGTHNVVTIGSYTPASGEIATQKVEFFDGTQTNGALGESAAAETLYISKAVSASNPIITHEDLSGITGAMVYKGVVDGVTNKLPTSNITAGWTYVVSTAGNYAGQACEPGDMIIAKETKESGITNSDWNVINGENQVENPGATIIAGASDATTIATVDGTNINAKVSVTGGTATIASSNDGVVTIKAGVTQTGESGTITNNTGSDITLKKLATSGAASDLTVASAVYGTGDATDDAQTALTNLARAITDANITIDGQKGTITTGNGITKVTADSKSFGIKIDSNNANGLSVGTDGLAMAIATSSKLGTVKVSAGNGLNFTDGVVSYTHNTTPITVASKNGNTITINGILTPDASDNITTSNTDKIALAAVAATGAASNLTVTSANYGGSTATTNAQTALDNLANNAVYVHNQTLTFNNNTATITISGADLQNSAITEIRDSSHNVVECDVVYTNATTITVTANGNPTGLYAIVHYKKAQAQA